MPHNVSQENLSKMFNNNNYKKKIISKRQMYRRVRTAMQQYMGSANITISENLVRTIENSSENLLPVSLSETPNKTGGANAVIDDINLFDYSFSNEVLIKRLSDEEAETYEKEVQNNESNDSSTKLKCWDTVHHIISQSASTDLSRILYPNHPELPLDSRTILKTPKNAEIKELGSGHYLYLSISSGLNNRLVNKSHSLKFPSNVIELSFNIDGIPVYNSSSIQFWPILCLIKNNAIRFQPFVVALFCGKSKPVPLETYLNDFILELNKLISDGFIFNNTFFNIKINNFVCDAPARSFIKCIKSHGGYSACDKCTETGIYINGRVVYRNISVPLRTDESFLSQADEGHHKGVSPLIQLPLGLIFQIPIDYMHSVCLGVTRKLLNSWISGSFRVRLREQSIKNMSARLLSLKSNIPHEINRKPRDFSELGRWKATEFRNFLLYLGPVVIKNIISLPVYEHFMLLHCGILILVCSRHLELFGTDVANEFLKIFVNHCEILYGVDYYVYNIHTLCHLSDEVVLHGPLDEFLAFPFENYLGQLKKLIRSPNKPLQQIYCRLYEIDNAVTVQIDEYELKFLFAHNNGPLLGLSSYKQFKQLITKDYVFPTISYCEADAYYLTKKFLVIQIQNILADTMSNAIIIGKAFEYTASLYSCPIESSEFNIHKIKNLSTALTLYNFDSILTKCFVYPIDGRNWFVSFPLLH